MEFINLTLQNIGAYYGENSFDLKVRSPQKNIVLFGGQNGCGKTTILEALKLALFGSLAYGFKTESVSYYERICTLLNQKAIKEGEKVYGIILTISKVENLQRKYYKIMRKWKLKNSKIKEYVSITRDNRYMLNGKEIDIFQSKLKQEIPPYLFELCLFDGEEISKIISNGKISDYLKNVSKVLFNLDLFESLILDLKDLNKVLSDRLYISLNEKRLQKLDDDIQQYHHRLRDLNEDIKELKIKLSEYEALLKKTKYEFELYGGLRDSQRNSLIEEERTLVEKRRQNNEEIKNFVSDVLPFFINRKLLSEIVDQIKKEKFYESIHFISQKMDRNKLIQFVQQLLQEKIVSDQYTHEELVARLYKQFFNNICPKNVKLIHRFSTKQISEIYLIHNMLEKLNPDDYHSLFDLNKEMLEQIHAIRKKIEIHDNSNDLQRFIERIEQFSRKIEQLKTNLEKKQQEHDEIQERINKIMAEKLRVKEELNRSKQIKNSLHLSSNIIEVSRRFTDLQLRKKLKQVEIEAVNIMKKLFRKRYFIKKIVIDPIHFYVHLYGEDKDELVNERLSAGEKELFIVSMIWAMFKCSGRKLPFVFDTLLGRLDQEHKEKVIENFLPTCADQVIVLSTDSEIDQKLYQRLSPNIAQLYTLVLNSNSQIVSIKNGQYFHFNKLELI